MRRNLAEDEPARHTPHLAAALINLGNGLREVGEHRDALTTDRQAVELWRNLAEDEPARHTPYLATALTNLGLSLGKAGDRKTQRTVLAEVVAWWARLDMLREGEFSDQLLSAASPDSP